MEHILSPAMSELFSYLGTASGLKISDWMQSMMTDYIYSLAFS